MDDDVRGGHSGEIVPRLPVSYRFLAGARTALRRAEQLDRGTNRWGEPLDPGRPTPVVLLHGTAGGAVTNWATLAPSLINAGYSVFDLTYGVVPGARWPADQLGGLRPLQEHSIPEVRAFVERVLAETGAPQVDVVGHSQGGLIGTWLAKHELPGKVRTVVNLGAPLAGVGGDRLLWLLEVTGIREWLGDVSHIAEELVHDSNFIRRLNGPDGTPYAPGVRYINIATRYDQFVVPTAAALVPGPAAPEYEVRNVLLQHGCMLDFVDHAALPSDPRAVDYVHRALDPDTPRRVRCLPTVPVVGGLLSGEKADRPGRR